jgi:hypothetical protein
MGLKNRNLKLPLQTDAERIIKLKKNSKGLNKPRGNL